MKIVNMLLEFVPIHRSDFVWCCRRYESSQELERRVVNASKDIVKNEAENMRHEFMRKIHEDGKSHAQQLREVREIATEVESKLNHVGVLVYVHCASCLYMVLFWYHSFGFNRRWVSNHRARHAINFLRLKPS